MIVRNPKPRAVITEEMGKMKIVIPSNKNWILIIVIASSLYAWVSAGNCPVRS